MAERTWLGIVAECGVKKRDERGGDPCKLPAGHGTEHPGWGACRFHGGNSPSGKKYAERLRAEARLNDAVVTLGLDREVDAITALTEELWRTAGAVEWLRGRVREIEPDQLGSAAAQALIGIYGTERDRLTKVAKTAIDVGLEERQVRVAEEQGRLIAQAIRGILKELHLSSEQWRAAPPIIRKHLTAIAVEEAKELTA